MGLQKLGSHKNSHNLRWEKFAPGPVRPVVLAANKNQSKPGDAPKKGRKRKTVPGDGEAVFANQSGGGQPVVPAPPQQDGEDILPPAQWPTRSTFAGRASGHQFAERRSKFYSTINQKYWKDHWERSFWKHCSNAGADLDAAARAFLAEVGGSPTDESHACVGRAKAKAKAKARAKAKTRPHGGRARAPVRCG